jgi:EAL domain-containing protein (putative c-di-GMP-specific phosphodiesterase class I)
MPLHLSALEVERALKEETIHLHYQPIVDLHSQELVGYEALTRWDSYDTEQIIKSIEHNGLVAVWIRCQVQQIRKALDQLPGNLFVAMNLGHNALVEPALVRELESFPYPERLHLEILESVNLNLVSAAVLDHISARITVKADDIGLEFPWLDRLVGVYAKHFDGLKLCESLTRYVLTDSACASACNHIIGMAKDNGLDTTAEWVHDKDQARMLRIFGCDCGQGELFGLGGPLPT